MKQESRLTCRSSIVVVSVVSLVLLALALAPPVEGQVVGTSADPGTLAVQYSAPYICGWLPPVPPQDDRHAKPGDYATAINVHNPLDGPVFGSFRIALWGPPGAPAPPRFPFVNFGIARDRVVQIDCTEIWARLNLPSGTFVKGAIHIGLSTQLPVAAIYTSQTHNNPEAGPDPGAGHSIDIEQIEPYFP